jgi:hypothetical protein
MIIEQKIKIKCFQQTFFIKENEMKKCSQTNVFFFYIFLRLSLPFLICPFFINCKMYDFDGNVCKS